MAGLLRFLLLLVGFVLARRVWRGFTASRRNDTRSTPRPDGPRERVEEKERRDLGTGQPIEEADYEELD